MSVILKMICLTIFSDNKKGSLVLWLTTSMEKLAIFFNIKPRETSHFLQENKYEYFYFETNANYNKCFSTFIF